jgi:hypothetical protein
LLHFFRVFIFFAGSAWVKESVELLPVVERLCAAYETARKSHRSRWHYSYLSRRTDKYINEAVWLFVDVGSKKAEWFATRLYDPEPLLFVGTVHIDNVLAYFTDRNEQEIIALPRDVNIIRREQLAVVH